MAYKLHPTLTPARQRWLETLERGPAQRGRGPVGIQCMRLGWTDWRIIDTRTGEATTRRQAQDTYGRAFLATAEHLKMDWTEVLTDEGRRVLAEARSAEK